MSLFTNFDSSVLHASLHIGWVSLGCLSCYWMAESLGEEWTSKIKFIIWSIISWNSCSWLASSSPDAWWSTNCFTLEFHAMQELRNAISALDVISWMLWGTEVVLWNQIFSIRPYAIRASLAFSCSHACALLEILFGSCKTHCWWMTEFRLEDWSWTRWSWWIGRISCIGIIRVGKSNPITSTLKVQATSSISNSLAIVNIWSNSWVYGSASKERSSWWRPVIPFANRISQAGFVSV